MAEQWAQAGTLRRKQEIKTVDLAGDARSLRQVVDELAATSFADRAPVKLLLGELPAGLDQWSPAYVEQALPRLDGVKASNDSGIFAFWATGDTPSMSEYARGLQYRSEHTRWTMGRARAADIFEDAGAREGNGGARWAYYSADLRTTSASVLMRDLSVEQVMCASDCRGRVDNVWVSTAGVTAQAHYDLVNNFFVQVHVGFGRMVALHYCSSTSYHIF
jgi:hypothetical protein